MERSYVVGVLEYNDKILVGKRNVGEPWNFLNIEVKGDEEDDNALFRLTRDRYGILVEVQKYIGENYLENGAQQRWYSCRMFSNQVIPEENLKLAFIPKKSVLSVIRKEEIENWGEEIRNYFS